MFSQLNKVTAQSARLRRRVANLLRCTWSGNGTIDLKAALCNDGGREAEIADCSFFLPASPSPASTHGLRLGKSPCAIEDFASREKETHCVVPPLRDRQAIGDFAVASAELDGDGTIRAFFRGDAVH